MIRNDIKMTSLPITMAKTSTLYIIRKVLIRAIRSHNSERASALDFKDTAISKCSHSTVAFDLFINTFLNLITLFSNFWKLFKVFDMTGPK